MAARGPARFAEADAGEKTPGRWGAADNGVEDSGRFAEETGLDNGAATSCGRLNDPLRFKPTPDTTDVELDLFVAVPPEETAVWGTNVEAGRFFPGNGGFAFNSAATAAVSFFDFTPADAATFCGVVTMGLIISDFSAVFDAVELLDEADFPVGGFSGGGWWSTLSRRHRLQRPFRNTCASKPAHCAAAGEAPLEDGSFLVVFSTAAVETTMTGGGGGVVNAATPGGVFVEAPAIGGAALWLAQPATPTFVVVFALDVFVVVAAFDPDEVDIFSPDLRAFLRLFLLRARKQLRWWDICVL